VVVTGKSECIRSLGFWKHQFCPSAEDDDDDGDKDDDDGDDEGKGRQQGGKEHDKVDDDDEDKGRPGRGEDDDDDEDKGSSQPIDDATLKAYLDIANQMSAVFSENTSAGTVEEARAILCVKGKDDDDDKDNSNRLSMRERANQQLLVSWLNFASGAVALDTMVNTDRDSQLDMTFGEVTAEVENILADDEATKEELERAKDICDRINNMKTCGDDDRDDEDDDRDDDYSGREDNDKDDDDNGRQRRGQDDNDRDGARTRIERPKADFADRGAEGTAPLTVRFIDKSTGEINSWHWDFGDGKTSTRQNAIHVYRLPGNYTVTLKISGPGGSDTIVMKNLIKVEAPRRKR
jgi:hypothetical protein